MAKIMTKGKSHYSVSIVKETIVLLDMDQGMSITNNAENVVAELHDLGIFGMPIVYCDTDGVWDQLAVNAAGEFIGFWPLRAMTMDDAISRAVR